MHWSSSFKGWLGFFLESPCPLCQRSTPQVFCRDCERQLQHCQLTQATTHQSRQDQLPVIAWGSYSGKLKQAIAALKYENQPQIAQVLGQWLAKIWLQTIPLHRRNPTTFRSWVVVPIPLHAVRQKQRGFNQADLIAQSFCQTTGLTLRSQGLQRVQETKPLFGLSVATREQTVANAFQLGDRPGLKAGQSQVWLLDDIYTTGSTIQSAIQTLQHHRITIAGVIVVAQTLR